MIFSSISSFPHVSNSANSYMISGISEIGLSSLRLMRLLLITLLIMVVLAGDFLSNTLEILYSLISFLILGISVGFKGDSLPNMFESLSYFSRLSPPSDLTVLRVSSSPSLLLYMSCLSLCRSMIWLLSSLTINSLEYLELSAKSSLMAYADKNPVSLLNMAWMMGW